jgi:trigger factor
MQIVESHPVKSAVENLNPTRVKLTVEVPFEELKPSLDAAYRTIGQQVQIPGFRKGKVPARIIDQRVGRGAVVQEAVNEALPQFYGQAAQENALKVIGQPEVDVTQVPVEDGQDLTFTVEVDVVPTIELPDLSDLAVVVDEAQVEESDVEEQLESLRLRFATLKGVDRVVESGDFVSIDLAATIGEEEIDSVTGVSYEVGSGNMLPGMDEALVGMNAGDTKEFTAPLAGGDHEGQDADCTVTVQAVKERELPELDDDFAQLASEFDTLEELRADARRTAELRKRVEQGSQASQKVMDALLERVGEVPVPDAAVEAEVHSHLEGEGRLEDDEHRTEVTEETLNRFRSQFVLDAVVEQEQVQVEQADIIDYLVQMSQQYGMDPNAFAQSIDQQGSMPAVVADVARRKALTALLERTTVTDTAGRTIDLSEVLPGSEEDEQEQPAEEASPEKAAADES